MLRARIPPPLYALGIGAIIWALNKLSPALSPLGGFWNAVGWACVALGVSLDGYALLSFLRSHTTVNPTQPERASTLIVSGVYRLSRNPMYLGLVLSLTGWTLLIGSPIFLPLVWLFMRLLDVVQIAPEETALRARFGPSYDAYSRQVNRWIGRRSDSEQ